MVQTENTYFNNVYKVCLQTQSFRELRKPLTTGPCIWIPV